MNKQEVIERIKYMDTLNINDMVAGQQVDMVIKNQVLDIISQIDETQKVVVPKFVAEWIEEVKAGEYSLYTAFDLVDGNDKTFNWLFRGHESNQETFARAWVDGYEVEKSYVVTDGNKLYLKEFDELNAVIIIDDVVGATDYAKRYSDKAEAQKVADELGWFVKEVE